MYSCSASEIFCEKIYTCSEGKKTGLSLLYLAQNDDCILFHKTFIINYHS